MRLRISHHTTYQYRTPARSVIQLLRLTPRSHEGQHVRDWRLDTGADNSVRMSEDCFGNILHTTDVVGPVSQLSISVEGEVETFDTAGVLRSSVERFPPQLFLRETPLTRTDAAMRDFSLSIFNRQKVLDSLHALMGEIGALLAFDTDSTHSATTAEEAFRLRRGVCQDFTHVFIGCARHAGAPARYVSGYYLHVDGRTEQDAGHAWAEAYVDELGWVGFDPTNGVCPQETHVSVARGLDYLGAAPVRGAKSGGDGEDLSVAVHVSQQRDQRQN